jgi:hypothetical protein
MIGAVDEPHAGTTQRLRGRQASETTPDDDDLFVRHEREPARVTFRKCGKGPTVIREDLNYYVAVEVRHF